MFGAKAPVVVLAKAMFVSHKGIWRLKEKQLEQTLKHAGKVGTSTYRFKSKQSPWSTSGFRNNLSQLSSQLTGNNFPTGNKNWDKLFFQRIY